VTQSAFIQLCNNKDLIDQQKPLCRLAELTELATNIMISSYTQVSEYKLP
jgi:hypothetical protein